MNAILKCVFVFVMLFGGISASAQVSGNVGAPGGNASGAKLNANVKPPVK